MTAQQVTLQEWRQESLDKVIEAYQDGSLAEADFATCVDAIEKLFVHFSKQNNQE